VSRKRRCPPWDFPANCATAKIERIGLEGGADMDQPTTPKKRVTLYIRLTLAAGLFGIAVGFYLNGMRDLDTSAFDIFAFAVRGILIGAAFWYFEIFWVRGPRGKRLRTLPYGGRLAVKVIAYVVLIEVAFLLGEAIFDPEAALGLFTSLSNG